MGQLRAGWKALRANYWVSLTLDAGFLILVFILISMWQTRDLPDDTHLPLLEAVWLDDLRANTVMVHGQVGVIYFFAPWCFYCKHSIENLEELVANGHLAWARTVALEYGNLDEVREFIAETGVGLPVLLGSRQTTSDWNIRAFPTYFVIDKEGQIASRSVGYSTKAGLFARVWMSQE